MRASDRWSWTNESGEHCVQGTGGPLGLGQPADKTLTDYERDVIIPQRALETVKQEFCSQHL